jgi:predicted alpha/beta hydrolase
VQDTTFPARDGYKLAATVFVGPRPPRTAVVISSATAVPRKIYRGFAGYLAGKGFAVLTFDYRGIAGSKPASLKDFPARMRDWAAFDVTAAIDHMRQVWPAIPLTYVGHSFGGQALGLIPNNYTVSRALIIAAQAGYWRLCKAPERYRIWLLLRFIIPRLMARIGHVPGRKLGLGEDLPPGVFTEWAGWCMQPRYFFDDPTLEALKNFPVFAGKLRALAFTDDPWATPAAVDLLCRGFTATQPEQILIRPREVKARRIGHFGFFRPERRDTLWRDAATWLAG